MCKLHISKSPVRPGILALITCATFFSFYNPGPGEMISRKGGHEYYDLENPDAKYKLPDYLEEISGLSYYGKGKIACVQDEKAFIYVWDLEEEKIISKYKFGDDADYEDIAVVDKAAYILRSNGHIYRVKNFKKKDRKVKKFNTPLKEKNDTEGLSYDPLTNSLLIACKGSPSIDEAYQYESSRAIYKFDLEEEELETRPLFLIDDETSFEPSGIAIHPLHGDIYIISSVGKLLIILNRKGKVLDVKELDEDRFKQPEGICFSPTGSMFISNEGRGKKGYILEFGFQEEK